MKEARILIVDDEPIRLLLGRILRLVGYKVAEAASGEEALLHLEERLYDLMILDMQLPSMDGKDVIRLARERWPGLLIIVLTGHASLESAILAIKSQVVDYLQKPATFDEILDAVADSLARHEARLQKKQLVMTMEKYPELLAGSESASSSSVPLERKPPPALFVGSLLLNRSERSVTFAERSGKMVTLTKGEMAVLSILMSYPGRVLSCQQLVQGAWGYETDADSAKSVIRPYVSRLRKKLELNSSKPRLIRTVRNRGYLFATDPR